MSVLGGIAKRDLGENDSCALEPRAKHQGCWCGVANLPPRQPVS
jgi:hypothetical protein